MRKNRLRRVHVVDKELLRARDLAALFRLDGHDVTTDSTVDSILDPAVLQELDVALIVARDRDAPIIEEIERVTTAWPFVQIIAIGPREQVSAPHRYLRAGAREVHAFPIDVVTLVEQVRALLGPLESERDDIVETSPAGRVRRLTARELEVAKLLAAGFTNKEAGRRLQISNRTVEVHRRRVCRKLGADNAADLVRIMVEAQGERDPGEAPPMVIAASVPAAAQQMAQA
jgi:two-component system response regulator FixJ